MTKKKRTISASLVAFIIIQAASPAYSGAMFDGYETGATPKSWVDGGGGRYMYGGNISYRFKRDTSFKPIFEIEPPGLKAGCGGISVSGGFIHLLGLDEIKTQLQSAGQGAMMGVVVGLVYSLPGIGDAFSKVHMFIRSLQQLLSNSCQMTAQATKAFIDQQRDLQKNGKPGPNETEVGAVFNGLNSTVSGWISSLNGGDDVLKDNIKNLPTSTDSAKKAPAREAAAMCTHTCQVAAKSNMPNIQTYVQNNANGKVYTQAQISNLPNIITDADRLRALEFAIVFMGYYGTDVFPKDKSVDENAQNFTNIIKAGGGAISKPTFERGLAFAGGNTNGDQLAKLLLYGTDSGVLMLPNIKIFPYYAESKNGDKIIDVNYGVLFGSKDTATDNTYEYQWKGFVTEGTTYLKDIIINNNVSAKPTIPSAFPNMSHYINVIRTQYRKGNNDAYVMSLINLLAKKNAVMLLQNVVFEMQTKLTEVGAGEETKAYKDAIDTIYKELERMNAADAGIADTIAIFEKIEREQTLDVTSGMRR